MSEIELHRKLLGDRVRNEALFAALTQAIKPGTTTVADIGAGTGFISLLARRLGARHCTPIEYTDALDLAREIARRNRVAGLTFVKAHSSEVRKPPKVDLVVSETLGNYALEEGLLETLVDARRFLTKGGRIIPCGLRQFVAPVPTARLHEEIDIWPRVGFDLDLGAARDICLNNMYVKTVRPEDLGGADTALPWDELDFSPQADAPPSLRTTHVAWSARDLRAERLFGFALWWEAELVPGVTLSTSPHRPPTHWEQVYLPLLRPLRLQADDRIELALTSDTRPQVGVRVAWQTRHVRGGRALEQQKQDTMQGRL